MISAKLTMRVVISSLHIALKINVLAYQIMKLQMDNVVDW